MADNPRPILVIDGNPTMSWPNVETATTYALKLVRKNHPDPPIYEEIVPAKDLQLKGGFAMFMHPLNAPILEPFLLYTFTGETDDGSLASGDIIFLDFIREDIEEINTLLKGSQAYAKWKDTVEGIIEAILTPDFFRSPPPNFGRPPWYPGPSCGFYRFTKHSIY